MINIKQVTERIPIPKKKRVAAYCRVSKDTANLLNSFDTQVSYYSEKIQKNKDWEFAGIYSELVCLSYSTSLMCGVGSGKDGVDCVLYNSPAVVRISV